MKKILLAMMLGGAVMGRAETTTTDFSYIDGVEDYFGMGPNIRTGIYDVAILLPGDVFEGFKVKEISMPVRSTEGIENYGEAKVWLSTALKVESNLNVPDAGTYDATISMEGDQAVLSGTLPESYTIGSEGVYVGVTINVLKSDDSTDYPISLGASDNSNSFWLHIPSYQAYLTWTNGYTKFGYGCGINVTLDGDNMPAHAVKIIDMPKAVYTALSDPASVDMTLSATGSQPVTSVEFEYTLNGTPYTYTYDLPEASAVGFEKTFEAHLEIPAQSELANEDVEFKVTKVNGEANDYDGPSASSNVVVLKSFPVRQTLFEEFTSTGCQYCTRGYAALAYIKENYPDFVVASYHTNYGGVMDPMTVTTSFPVTVTGYPAASLNRNGTCDPYFGNQLYDSKIPIVNEILALNSVFTPWEVSVSHNWESDDLLTATANVCNVVGYDNVKYRLAFILVEDGLKGIGEDGQPVALGWTQINGYFSTMQSDNVVPQLNDFCRGGIYGTQRVNGLVFDDVVIYSEGYNGISGSVPDSMSAYEEVSYSYTFDLSKVKPELLQDKNKLRIIAAVVDKNGRTLNCAKDEVDDHIGTGVESVNDAAAPVEYYNLSGVKVADPANGIFVRRQGSKTEKVVIR